MGNYPFSGGGGGGGSGTVTSVTATDTSIVISGTPTVAPTIATNTLDVVAAQHPPAAAVPMNSQKITGLANGSGAQDAAAFGQVPTTAGQVGALPSTDDLSAIATANATAGNVAMNGHKLTGLAAAQSSGDAVSLLPWQLTPEASGCVADGQLIGDAAITSGQPTLTTVGVVAPSTAPTVNHAGTLGTILAGIYQVKYTYVSPFGETTASNATSVTTTGSTSTITVTTPASTGVPGGATGVNYYVTLAGGSTFYKQVTNWPFQNNWELFTPPATTTQPPVSNTTASAPFTPADTGKVFRLIGAGAAGADLRGTVTYVSATSLTLSVNAGTTVSGVGFVWGTDNTANMNTFLAALQTAASAANNYTAEGVCKTGIYLLNTAPVVGGAFGGNCVLQLPNPPNGGPKLKIALRGGSQDAATLPVYQQMWPEVSGTCFMYIGAAGTNDATFGAAHVFGTPTNPNIYVNESGVNPGTVNMKMVTDSIRVVVPYKGGIGGFDLFSAAESDNRSCSCQALAIVPAGGSWPAMSTSGPSTNQWGWGLREPGAGNNAFSYTEGFTAEGLCYGYGPSEHLVAVDIFCAYCVTAIEAYSGNGISMVHNAHIVSAGAELSTNGLGAFPTGSIKIDIDNFRTESLGKQIFDPSNQLQGTVGLRCQGATGTYNTGFVTAGNATGVSLINLMSSPGPLSGAAAGDPGPPATTVAWANFYYRHALVTATLAGGTFTSLTVGAVAQAAAAGASTFTFMLPAGQSYTPVYSAGTLTHQITLI